MSKITFNCESCGAVLTATHKAAGRNVACPECGEITKVWDASAPDETEILARKKDKFAQGFLRPGKNRRSLPRQVTKNWPLYTKVALLGAAVALIVLLITLLVVDNEPPESPEPPAPVITVPTGFADKFLRFLAHAHKLEVAELKQRHEAEYGAMEANRERWLYAHESHNRWEVLQAQTKDKELMGRRQITEIKYMTQRHAAEIKWFKTCFKRRKK